MHDKIRLPRTRRPALALSLAGLLPALVLAQAADGSDTDAPQRIVITGATANTRDSSTATGLKLAPRETPQSISVITRQLIDDFKLTSVNDVLGMATGVVVEQPETDRTYYTARGFDIVNFQVDGIGIPMVFGLVDGDLDASIYERVEVVRGASGMLVGTGNPSATINFVRKRPTRQLQGSAALTLGSWNDKRVELDVGGPLNAAGTLRGRAVAAVEDKDSYLQRYHHRKGVFSGIVEADVGERTVLAAGVTTQQNRPQAPLWGALPLYFSDGTPTNLDRSSSTSVDWTRWDTDTSIVFGEATHTFANGWQAKGQLTHKEVEGAAKLFYVYGTPDRSTGLGLIAYPSTYDHTNRQDIVDLRASGPFRLGGRTHTLVLGASASRSRSHEQSLNGDTVNQPLPSLYTWDGTFAEPQFTIDGGGSNFTDRQHSVYAATQLNLADGLKLIGGFNHTQLDSSGSSYGASRDKAESRTTPYIGAIVDLTPDVALYANRTAIFLPQSEIDAKRRRLDPATGHSAEVGLKTDWLDKKLQGTLALFRARQNNLASSAGYDTVGNFSYYEGVDTVTQGYELELSGQPLPGLTLNAGYTQLRIEDGDGAPARTFTPRRVLHVATTWTVRPGIKLGANLGLRSAVTRAIDGGPTLRQGGYGLLDLMASWDIAPQWNLALNLRNVTDRKYLTSLYWDQGFYGAPRNGSVSLTWKF